MFGCYHSPSGYCLCKKVEKDIKIDSHIEEVHKCYNHWGDKRYNVQGINSAIPLKHNLP